MPDETEAKKIFKEVACAIVLVNFLRAVDIDAFERNPQHTRMVRDWDRRGIPWNVHNHSHQQKVVRWAQEGSLASTE